MTPKTKIKRIPSISPRRRASRDAYGREARKVIIMARTRGHYCPIAALWKEIVLVECVHHLRGKHCEELRHDKRGWLLVSLWGHRWIDQNRDEARRRGWLAPLGKWNVKFKPGEPPMPGSVADLQEKGLL